MKIYVACTSKQVSLARSIMKVVEQWGYELVYDWTEAIHREESMELSELQQRAVDTISAVGKAKCVLIVLTPDMRSIGSSIEFGAALVANKTVIFYGGEAEQNGPLASHFFANHPRVVRVENPNELQSRLAAIASV